MVFTQRRLHNGLILQVFCWLCFFLVPAINAHGAMDGRWMRLCTSVGVVAVEAGAREQPGQHVDQSCPCVQHATGTPTLALPSCAPTQAILAGTPVTRPPETLDFAYYRERAPPVFTH